MAKYMQWENFTAGRVAGFKCEAGKKQSFFFDGKTPGLGVRVTAAGSKSYIFETKIRGKSLRITIGDVKTYTIDAAQKIAMNYRAQTDLGIDPRQAGIEKLAEELASAQTKIAETAEKAIQEKRELVTLGAAWSLYISARRERWGAWHLRDHENIIQAGGQKKKRGKGLTEAGPLASLSDVKLCDLTEQRIGEWLVAETKARPTRASLAFRLLSVFVNWCDTEADFKELISAGTCKSRKVREAIPKKNTVEGDSLQREQLKKWFGAVRQMENKVESAYLQTLLLTGARRRELPGLLWTDVDFKWLSMTIRDKIEGERTIPLCPYVAHLLGALPRRNEWVFSSVKAESGYLQSPTKGHKKALKIAGLPDMTINGLRRSFRSLAEWTETPAGVVAQIQGHKPSAIAEKHYTRRPLDLLRKWHTKLETWILDEAGVEYSASTGLRIVAAAA